MTAPAILPAGMSIDGGHYITVDVHDIERGDRLTGLATPIDSILFHGGDWCWWLLDDRQRCIATRKPGSRVQVYRGGLSSHDCSPFGIERARTLTLVRS